MSLMTIVLYDSLTGQRQELKTLVEGQCGIYCCGPTVYGLSHLGNARAAMVPDVIVRFLRYVGYEVKYVRNVTDIDDKIIECSQAEGIPAQELANKYAAEYAQDMAALFVEEPTVTPRVSDHLPEIISIIESLIAKDLAYDVDGDVYFRVEAFEKYGQLSNRVVADMLESAGSRVDVDDRKQSPVDFALWKAAKKGEPAWASPWGEGRPGWHIECSAMSSVHLGESFDIHTGGRDLIFPHHENEIAQSQGAHGDDTFSTYWMHNGFIDFNGEKMSKSLGNFFTTREILNLYDAESTRLFLLTVHYRSGLNFDVELKCPACEKTMTKDEQASGACACGVTSDREVLRQNVRFPGLEESDDRLAYIYTTLNGAREFLAANDRPASEESVLMGVAGLLPNAVAQMANDFNTSGALGTLSKALAEANTLLDSGKGVSKTVRYLTLEKFVQSMAEISKFLGCFGQDPAAWLLSRRDKKAARMGLDIQNVEDLLLRRIAARENKEWASADQIRDELTDMGVAVQDGPEGSQWSFI
ncbi:MAG: cysteinyl-tRNA synthetase [Candidatus Krumholzibacteriia bacterium]|jgi:cysteinyl-tRNA synthetase